MKIRPPDYAYMKEQIAKLTPEQVQAQRDIIQGKEWPGLDRDKLFRWNLWWLTKSEQWMTDNLYKYVNDNHIDTAFKAILKELDIKLAAP